MLSEREFIRQSLELNLFFMRIAKEHSIFLEAGFMFKDYNLIYEAEALKNLFTGLLIETLRLSQGIIAPEVANSGELVTDLTVNAERETEFYTGIRIDNSITNFELNLAVPYERPLDPDLLRQVQMLNYRAMVATNQIIAFKTKILQSVLSCKIFTQNYPLLLDHILREAHFYLRMLTKLQTREEIDMTKDMVYQETFWNRIMAEHARFIRGLLDPTEVQLFNTANDFGERFDRLTAESQQLSQQLGLAPKVTQETLTAAIDIRNFKRQGTEGLINCKIRSIAFPLLGDHVVREANHYIRLLNVFKQQQLP